MEKARQVALELSQLAGETIRRNFSLAMKKEWKADGSPLTATDIEINSRVIERIRKEFPNHRILGEEESFGPAEAEYVWVCDPVDGTIPFSHGYPICVFSLALCRAGRPILGVVHDPFLRREVIGEQGKGATLNGSPTRVSQINSIKGGMFGVDGLGESIFGLAYKITQHGGLTATLRSYVYEGLLVSMGEFSGAVFNGHTPWDGAALKIICEEAGGKVTDLAGNEQPFDREINGVICSNGLVHDQLIEFVASGLIRPNQVF